MQRIVQKRVWLAGNFSGWCEVQKVLFAVRETKRLSLLPSFQPCAISSVSSKEVMANPNSSVLNSVTSDPIGLGGLSLLMWMSWDSGNRDWILSCCIQEETFDPLDETEHPWPDRQKARVILWPQNRNQVHNSHLVWEVGKQTRKENLPTLAIRQKKQGSRFQSHLTDTKASW